MEDILASIRRIIADDQDGARPTALAPAHAPPPQDPPSADSGAADEEILDLADIAEPLPAFHSAEDRFPPSHVDLDAFARALPEPEDEPSDPASRAEDVQHQPAPTHATPAAAPSAPAPAAASPTASSRHPEPASEPAIQPAARSEPAPAPAAPASPFQMRPPEPQAAEPPTAPETRSRPQPVHQPTAQAATGAQSGEERLISAMTDSAVSQAFNMLTHTVFSQNAMTLEDVVKDMLRPLLKDWLDDNLPPLVERLVRAEIERVARGGTRR